MQIVKYILIALYILNCIGLIAVTMMQQPEEQGASGAITGSTTNNFFEKNKSRTKEGKLKKWTVILGTSFAILTVVLGIVYLMK